MSNRIDIQQQQLHQHIMENSSALANMDDFDLLALQMEAQSAQNKDIPPSPPSKMKIRAIQNSDLKPAPNAFVPLPSSFKSKEIQKETKKDKVASVAPPSRVEEKLSDEDEAFFASQIDRQFAPGELSDTDFMSTSTSRQMKLYEYQHTRFHGLNQTRKDNREMWIGIAHSKALELSEMTKRQADRDLLFSIGRGILSLVGVTQPDHIQKLFMGIGEALGQLSFVQKTSLEAKKIPIQTKLDLLKGAEIPQLDEEQRNYARMVQELDACIQRLREMEMNTMHSIHQG